MDQLHVIIGSGAVGSTTALALADGGKRVRVITRRGSGPTHESIELVAADAGDATRMTELTRATAAIYNCANPRYARWETDWPPIANALLEAAVANSARLVTMSNLYMYAPSKRAFVESDPASTTLRKGQVRAEIWAKALETHERGLIEATEARASDFLGPMVTDQGMLGERVMPRILAGKPVRLIGDPDAPHSWSYMPDVAAMLVILGEHPLGPGRVWHVPSLPPRPARQMVQDLARSAGVADPPVHRVPSVLLRAAGIFSSDLGEVARVLYQWDRPFSMDSTAATETFALQPTPLPEVLSETVAWWLPRAVEPAIGDPVRSGS